MYLDQSLQPSPNSCPPQGYVDAAKAFAAESGTQPTADLDTITERMQIRQSIQSGHVEEAIDRVNDLNPEILEEQHHIFFHLQQQRLIELIRTGDTAAALDFAQEYLAPRGEEHQEFLQELGAWCCPPPHTTKRDVCANTLQQHRTDSGAASV